MNLKQIVAYAREKDNFSSLEDYADFCRNYLTFIFNGLQAVIVAQNENNYVFFQYKEDGNFMVTRPINSNVMLSIDNFDSSYNSFMYGIKHIREIQKDSTIRSIINKFVYTCQQSIGAALDALPAGESNSARKINGDLFERYIRIIISAIGIEVRDGVVKLPVVIDNDEAFSMSYQHDLIIESSGKIRAIGSVKTSSKDRIDKIFIDKFLYNRLTNTNIPHFAVFLNDVQRKGREPKYGINTTFLTGRYKGYTVKLNPLDGVYYCDIRPIMEIDPILQRTIRTFDCLLTEDIWNF